MAFANQQLFLDRFKARNKKDYPNNPEFLAKLNNLKLEDITFNNFQKVTANNVVHHVVDLTAPNVVIAVNQDFIPADFAKHGTATLNDPKVLNANDLSMRTDPGIFLIDNNGVSAGALLVKKDEKNKANVLSIVKAATLYELTDADITVNSTVTEVTISSFSVVGKLFVVESKDPANALHDGTFVHDGTLTY